MSKASELREKSAEELEELAQKLSKEVFNLRNEFKTTREMKKTMAIRERKRERARVLTLINEKRRES